jgi:hypothetical protein
MDEYPHKDIFSICVYLRNLRSTPSEGADLLTCGSQNHTGRNGTAEYADYVEFVIMWSSAAKALISLGSGG